MADVVRGYGKREGMSMSWRFSRATEEVHGEKTSASRCVRERPSRATRFFALSIDEIGRRGSARGAR
jgi:hypothetical protein